jgi:hypothetical protein
MNFTTKALRYYKENPAAYQDKCHSIQDAAQKFDWKYSIETWIELMEGAGAPRDSQSAGGTGQDEREHTFWPELPATAADSELQTVFNNIYRTRGFGGSESFSGPGSTMAKTERLRKELPEVLRFLGVKTIIDAPCGDMNWIRYLEYNFDSFFGIDVVPELINRLRTEFPPSNFHFEVSDICHQTLPKADAILCRDCFVHLPYSKIWDAVRLFRLSGTHILLTTTYPDKTNQDVLIGGWRPLNLEAEPFLWPAPIKLIGEVFSENADQWDNSKCLGVWDLSLLPDSPPNG